MKLVPKQEPEVLTINNRKALRGKFLQSAISMLTEPLGLSQIKEDRNELYRGFLSRYNEVSNVNDYIAVAELVIDMGSIVMLLNDYGDTFLRYEGDGSDAYDFLKENITYSDGNLSHIGGKLPQFMRDALEAIQEKGSMPLAGEVLTAVDHFRELAERKHDSTEL